MTTFIEPYNYITYTGEADYLVRDKNERFIRDMASQFNACASLTLSLDNELRTLIGIINQMQKEIKELKTKKEKEGKYSIIEKY